MRNWRWSRLSLTDRSSAGNNMTKHKDKLPRIMTVDDETEVTTVICDYFREEGYEIAGYSDAQAALFALGDSTVLPDVILVDIMMPSIDGYEFSRLLQAEPRLKNIPSSFLPARIVVMMHSPS